MWLDVIGRCWNLKSSFTPYQLRTLQQITYLLKPSQENHFRFLVFYQPLLLLAPAPGLLPLGSKRFLGAEQCDYWLQLPSHRPRMSHFSHVRLVNTLWVSPQRQALPEYGKVTHLEKVRSKIIFVLQQSRWKILSFLGKERLRELVRKLQRQRRRWWCLKSRNWKVRKGEFG